MTKKPYLDIGDEDSNIARDLAEVSCTDCSKFDTFLKINLGHPDVIHRLTP